MRFSNDTGSPEENWGRHATAFKRDALQSSSSSEIFPRSDHAPVFIIKQMLSPFSRMRPRQRLGTFWARVAGEIMSFNINIKSQTIDVGIDNMKSWGFVQCRKLHLAGRFLPLLLSKHLIAQSESCLKKGKCVIFGNSWRLEEHNAQKATAVPLPPFVIFLHEAGNTKKREPTIHCHNRFPLKW